MRVLTRVPASSLKPDVVFLQEVVVKNLDVIKEKCSNDYAIILGTEKGNAPSMQYFIVMLLRRNTVEYVSHSVTPFSGSIMSRAILHVVVGGNHCDGGVCKCRNYSIICMIVIMSRFIYKSMKADGMIDCSCEAINFS